MRKKWEYYEQKEDLVSKIANKHNISKILARILINRNIIEEDEINIFLNPKRNNFHDPFLMLDMEKAVERIIKAIHNKEKTIIYGDYDVDGITSITVLKKFLKERGLEVDYYIPNRLEEGYGLNRVAIEEISQKGYTLMITVDCGISGKEEIDFANKLGIETIITDHHEQSDELPKAYAVVNPKRKDNTYPFRGLAGVGVVFKLIQAIAIKLELEEKEYLKYLDIVCIGTISDIVPLTDDTIKKLCDIFDVSSDYLLGKSEIEKIEEPYENELEKVLFSKAKELTDDEKFAVLSVINAIKKDVDDGKI